MMAAPLSRTAAIWRINVLGLTASLIGATAWSVWPETAEWWGFGVLAILLALGALQLVVQALGTAWRLFEHERAVAVFERHGREARSSQMATLDQLKQAGMLDV